MSVTVDITISEDLVSDHGASDTPESGEDDVPEPGSLQRWAEAAYLGETPAVASMLITTAEQIRQLNKQYRDKDKPTNVLSFPMALPEDVAEEIAHEISQEMFEQDDALLLGDIALCAAVIKQEAMQQSKSQEEHWAHMVVHGMLHLQGYDHIEEDEAEKMEQLEIKILDRLGFSDPYQ